jgi:hypothetical protein
MSVEVGFAVDLAIYAVGLALRASKRAVALFHGGKRMFSSRLMLDRV